MYGSVIYHRRNNGAGAFISIEDNKNKKNSTSVHEAEIPPVFAQWNIFAFDSRFSKTLYRSICVNTFRSLDCLVVSLHDILEVHK